MMLLCLFFSFLLGSQMSPFLYHYMSTIQHQVIQVEINGLRTFLSNIRVTRPFTVCIQMQCCSSRNSNESTLHIKK